MNLKRRIILFFTISGSSGFFAAVGSILGGILFGQTGLYVGALIFGVLSVVMIISFFRKISWVDPSNFNRPMIGGVIGFLFASVIAVYGSRYFNNPVAPILSVFLTGIGTVIGLRSKASK